MKIYQNQVWTDIFSFMYKHVIIYVHVEESGATSESMDGDDVDAAPQFYSPLKHQPAIKSTQPNV
jgi:hypothetical protein